ncbi:MAG: GNAT family N-acetyltransferase [Thermoanaerobaculia bacterium]
MKLPELVPFTEADIDRLISWVPSLRTLQFWTASSFAFPLTREHLVGHIRDAAEQGDRLIFKVIDPETREPFGHVELGAINPSNRSTRIGRVLIDPALKGRGYGVKLMHAAMAKAFDEMSMHRVDLWVFDFNSRAIACYERAGFRHEGKCRDFFRMGDEYWSMLIMSVLEEEWRSLRSASDQRA